LRNWQRGNDHSSAEDDHQGANRGEYRTMNEKVNEHEKVGLQASSSIPEPRAQSLEPRA